MRISIDIGTHMARAACLDVNGRPQLIHLAHGAEGMPALARQTMRGLEVGVEAALALAGNAETTVCGCTRLMGRAGALPRELLERLPYSVREVSGEAICDLLHAEVRAADVYGQIARALVDEVERVLGEQVDAVVLTVPASAEDRFRIQARAAVEAQGIPVLRLINRPAAALLALAEREPLATATARHVAVVDCGGGTTDVSIARCDADSARVLATAGDALLGGDDLIWEVARQLNMRFQNIAGVDVFAVDESHLAAQGLRSAAAEALGTLRLAPEALLALDHGGGFGRDLMTLVRRSDVDAWLAPWFERIAGLCQRALASAKLRSKQIDAVLLIGDAAGLPGIHELVVRAFGRAPIALPAAQATEMPVLGAASAISSGPSSIWDVTPYPLGINCYYGEEELFSPIVAANTTIPSPPVGAQGAFVERYTTRYPDQTRVKLDVLQYRGPRIPATSGAGRVYPHECEVLGSWDFAGLQPRKGQHAAFSVTFTLDADGILHLHAEETATGHTLNASVDRGIG
ncbi:MAG TPA: Hsp70 family protein [Roseiflexaceae bacterium]|nr:Hsp70 family protein [Roseiflexaceae bacterium]